MQRSLSETWTLLSTEEFGWDGMFEGFALAEPISDDDRNQSLRLVDAALQPTPAAAIIPELTRLRMTTISRGTSEGDMTLMLAAYASSLEKYPRDIVISALRFWSETEKFWPSLSEIIVISERWIRRRRALREALS